LYFIDLIVAKVMKAFQLSASFIREVNIKVPVSPGLKNYMVPSSAKE
jgi:hypothetical protein